MQQKSTGALLKSYLGCVPPEGALSLTQDLDFTNGITDIETDLMPVQSIGKFSAVQAIYFDNSLNGSPLSMTCNGTNQGITIPPNACGYMPVAVIDPAQFTFHSVGGVVVRIIYFNFYIPPCVWSAISVKGS